MMGNEEKRRIVGEKAVSFEICGRWVFKNWGLHYWYMYALKARAVEEREREI